MSPDPRDAEQLPSAVDFRLLGQCDLRCPYCFGPRHNLRAMPSPDTLAILGFIADLGVKAVVFSGGEPCLVKDLPDILKRTVDLGMTTVLSTNGIIFRRRLHEIAPYLDWVGLPLDAASPQVNRVMRPGRADQHQELVSVVSELRRDYGHVGIKLGSVASALNKDDLAGIPDVLQDYPPDVWKLYQVVYSSYGADNESMLRLSDGEFESLYQGLVPLARAWGVPLLPYRRSARPGRYLFIEPNGDVQTSGYNDEIPIGNILEEPAGVVRNWHKFINTERLESNFAQTYPAAHG